MPTKSHHSIAQPGIDRRHVEREPDRTKARGVSANSGIGVDADGRPVIDPTENVRELFEAGSQRQDDLRVAERRLQEEKVLRVETELRAIQREVTIRAEHQRDLDTLEAKRLDAVRSVDQLAVKTEADRASAAVSALATQAATTAETLRSAVNTSATNLATQLDRTVTALTERIAALEKSSYTGAGKQAVIDPQLAELIAEMRSVAAHNAATEGRSAGPSPEVAALRQQIDFNSAAILKGGGKAEGLNSAWVIGLGVLGAIGTMLGIGTAIITLVIFLNRAPSAPVVPTPAPQIIYSPSPPGTLLPTTPPQAPPR